MPIGQLIDSGLLSERIHPGPALRWHGTPAEWHQRFILYCDTLTFEKELSRLQEIAAAIPALQEELDMMQGYVNRITPGKLQSRALRPDGNEASLI